MYDNAKSQQIWKNAEFLNNVKFKHDITWTSYAHILTTYSVLFIIKEFTYPVLYKKICDHVATDGNISSRQKTI